jgi:hypothetical protein
MSSTSIDVPTLRIGPNDLENLVGFISTQEQRLKRFGAIKIQLDDNCKLALKKTRKTSSMPIAIQQTREIRGNERIYAVEKGDHVDMSTQNRSSEIDDFTFWWSLPHSSNEQHQSLISVFPTKSFFYEKMAKIYFDIHRIPEQSLLKLGGRHVTDRFIPCLVKTHESGGVFPLHSVRQRLFLLDYHHEGGSRYWYIIPAQERDTLRRTLEEKNLSLCQDHGKFLIDPVVLDRCHIRYHRIVQNPNEFVVLAAGVLSQSFTTAASWSESVAFALPSWIDDGHANSLAPSCQCNISTDSSSEIIDIGPIRRELMKRDLDVFLNGVFNNDDSAALRGSLER